MTIEEIEKQIFCLQAELEKKKKEQSKPWRANKYCEFYYISETGVVREIADLHSAYDDMKYDYGNYYHTKELAERDAKKLTIRNKIRRYHDMLCPEYEFTKDTMNYIIKYNYDDGYYQVDKCYNLEVIGVVAFDTFEHAQAVCNILNADLLSY